MGESPINRTISIAPMMDWTDRHDRYFLRLISTKALLYTEMVTTGAVIHGDRQKLLGYSQQEHPVAVQLGGGDPDELAQAAAICQGFGYDEINLNVGCPSDRVQRGKIGACLMAEPKLVAQCVEKMQQEVDIPVSVKSRTGIDDLDTYQHLDSFISEIAAVGCEIFIIHARKAWLEGLSPKQNREVPPLHYDRVYQIKSDYPQLHISINGGITTLEQAEQHLQYVDGVMIGREAYQNPYILSEVDQRFYRSQQPALSRYEVVQAMLPYIEQHLSNGGRLNHISRHMLGLFHAQPKGRLWRRYISENANQAGANHEVIERALELLQLSQVTA
ncbi:MAG: tRNA dihydrouridine(20/20a) synthase DusA [Kangiellaceae bacterium]|jgi:tRNA-dihydrouridine synthase A|nr:tRNA dihydrouridine(20/20a) synthase DusA [Kangiellaceae bacterium]